MRRVVNALDKLSWRTSAYAVLLLFAATASPLPAQTFATLVKFNGGAAGAAPNGGLIQGVNGDLYGTTQLGGYNGGGTVFKMTPSGTLTTLYRFCKQPGCPDGGDPEGVILATDGNFYGTTGALDGSIFKITPAGVLTTLHNFTFVTDGRSPQGLLQASNGDFYGATAQGGANAISIFGGTIFEMTPSGTLTTLYSFCSQGGAECTDGANPSGALVQDTNGDFYGTTAYGGVNNAACVEGSCGTVFRITPAGALATLYSFCSQPNCADGYEPFGGLVQAIDGNFYGVTGGGGANNWGTFFLITPGGALTTLYNFDAPTNGGLVQATDGNFYGTTVAGGYGWGTIFQLTPSGTMTTLYSFCATNGCADGSEPILGLVQDTNGDFYGATVEGGLKTNACIYSSPFDTCGTIFSLSAGLGPFVRTQTTAGRAAAKVKILGTGLTGATSVTFNGTLAVFQVVSSSEITTTVPAGATTGIVQVITPGGTLSSNVPFRVLP